MNIPEISAAEAASYIRHGEMAGVGGFGPAGAPKSIPPAIAARAREEHAAGREFKIDIVTGASIGASCDGELAKADAIDRRLPFSVNPEIRAAYNSGKVRYTDLNLSDNATFLRQGITGPMDWGILEACDVQEIRGKLRIYLTAGIGIAPTICRLARKEYSSNSTPGTQQRSSVCTISTRSKNLGSARQCGSRNPWNISAYPISRYRRSGSAASS